jgi:hypothetical protein
VARLANSQGNELFKAEGEKSARSKNPDAIDLDMRGRALYLERNRNGADLKDITLSARSLFEQALAIDPKTVDALADVADTYVIEYYFFKNPGTNYETKLLGQLDRAITLAPDNAFPYMGKAFYLNMTGRSKEGLRAATKAWQSIRTTHRCTMLGLIPKLILASSTKRSPIFFRRCG